MAEREQLGTRLPRLREHHLRGLSEADYEVLAARMCLGAPGAVGELLYLSAAQVRARVERLLDLIVVPLGLPRDGWFAGLWLAFHHDCCAARAFLLAENDRRFTREEP